MSRYVDIDKMSCDSVTSKGKISNSYSSTESDSLKNIMLGIFSKHSCKLSNPSSCLQKEQDMYRVVLLIYSILLTMNSSFALRKVRKKILPVGICFVKLKLALHVFLLSDVGLQ